MKQLVYLLFLLSLTTLSCTKEVEIDIPEYNEDIVIDGRIETNEPPFILISKSQNIYSPTDINTFINGFVSGANITVSDGTTTVVLEEFCSNNLPPGTESIVSNLLGVSEDELANFNICGYTSLDPSIFGQVGKTYSLKVELEDKTFTAQTQIKAPTPLTNLYWKVDGNLLDYGYAWATISDPPGQFDAYKWEVKRINLDSNGLTLDPNFIAPFSPVFNDDFFDGLTFDFFYDNPQGYEDDIIDETTGLYPKGDTLVIKFSKIDRDVYEFMEKKYVQIATSGNPFATPTNIPSNIIGGALGVWAGYSPTYDTLYCYP
ncbi:MAG: hypothetical protein CL844_07665 [Crocinitomicaceae bacterium]|nr:hypothetical protein [Crocinitomicaceae bacterium]|tara:strand:- start:106774 stop:107724 length:951 start_codon:yes stop_codon:yes gene_type:complete